MTSFDPIWEAGERERRERERESETGRRRVRTSSLADLFASLPRRSVEREHIYLDIRVVSCGPNDRDVERKGETGKGMREASRD